MCRTTMNHIQLCTKAWKKSQCSNLIPNSLQNVSILSIVHLNAFASTQSGFETSDSVICRGILLNVARQRVYEIVTEKHLHVLLLEASLGCVQTCNWYYHVSADGYL